MDNNYRIYNIPNLKEGYTKVISDNLEKLVDSIYNTFTDPEMRAALAFHLILSSGNLISVKNSIRISKDLDDLKKNQSYLNKWEKPHLKRQFLNKELETLRKHTEIDDSISLNGMMTSNDTASTVTPTVLNGTEYDIKTGIDTLNVSEESTGCELM